MQMHEIHILAGIYAFIRIIYKVLVLLHPSALLTSSRDLFGRNLSENGRRGEAKVCRAQIAITHMTMLRSYKEAWDIADIRK